MQLLWTLYGFLEALWTIMRHYVAFMRHYAATMRHYETFMRYYVAFMRHYICRFHELLCTVAFMRHYIGTMRHLVRRFSFHERECSARDIMYLPCVNISLPWYTVKLPWNTTWHTRDTMYYSIGHGTLSNFHEIICSYQETRNCTATRNRHKSYEFSYQDRYCFSAS